jgi:pantothenate kinase type III
MKIKYSRVLLVDIGHTNIKYCYVTEQGLTKIKVLPIIAELKAFNDYDFAYICCVNKSFLTKIIRLFTKPYQMISSADIADILLSLHPRVNNSKTIGVDRLLASYYVTTLGYKNTVIINAGSAITIDYIDHEQKFCGGNILLGLDIIKQAYEANFPHFPPINSNDADKAIDTDMALGRNSTEAVNSGFYNTINGAIEHSITKISSQLPVMNIVSSKQLMINLEHEVIAELPLKGLWQLTKNCVRA